MKSGSKKRARSKSPGARKSLSIPETSVDFVERESWVGFQKHIAIPNIHTRHAYTDKHPSYRHMATRHIHTRSRSTSVCMCAFERCNVNLYVLKINKITQMNGR